MQNGAVFLNNVLKNGGKYDKISKKIPFAAHLPQREKGDRMKGIVKIIALVIMVSAILSLAACKQSEQPQEDRMLNNREVVLVMKAVMAEGAGDALPSGIDMKQADKNGDGKLNNRDVIAVMKEVLAELAK